MTSSIQRIQAAISQANASSQAQAPAAGQSLVCSFDIEGRTPGNYLGINSIAEVSPPWFPKDAFQVRGSREKSASPMITLKQNQPKAASQPVQTIAKAQIQINSDVASSSQQDRPAAQAPISSGITSSVSVDVFQAMATADMNEEQELATENLATENLATENLATENLATENLATENLATEKLALELLESNAEQVSPESATVTAEILANLFEQAEPLATGAAESPNETTPSTSDLSGDSEQKQPHKAIMAPVTATEQAAAQALAQSLSHSLTKSLPQSSETPEDQADDINIKPIETVAPPALPRSKSPELSSHQNSTNPMLPLELLQNIGQEVIIWQEALQEVHQKIQTLYQEGPILNGWLEKHSDAGVYILCGLDSTGESWRRPCHPDQLQTAGLAIGRYKKLRLLLGEKQRLDQRIKRLSETLTMLRLRLRAY